MISDVTCTNQELIYIYRQYLEIFPVEIARTEPFYEFLMSTTAENLYRRNNFNGHITTSAFIIDRKKQEILLLRHKVLQRWFQPGGHFEQDESLLHSALREAVEETHIPASQLINIPVADDTAVPFDIDPHHIPANEKKREDAHYHHDVRYLFEYTGQGSNSFNEEEATGLRWVPFAELANDDTFGKMIEKIARYI